MDGTTAGVDDGGVVMVVAANDDDSFGDATNKDEGAKLPNKIEEGVLLPWDIIPMLTRVVSSLVVVSTCSSAFGSSFGGSFINSGKSSNISEIFNSISSTFRNNPVPSSSSSC